MKFDIDKQTIKDLQLFPDKGNDRCVYAFYNRTTTIGGQEMLYESFNSPISDIEFLQTRKEEINFFFTNSHYIKFNSSQIEFIEHYLKSQRIPLKDNVIDAFYDGISYKLNPAGDYYIISEGIKKIIQLLINLKSFLKGLNSLLIPSTLEVDFENIKKFTSAAPLKNISDSKKLSFSQINKLDYLFRVQSKNSFRELLKTVYKIDVLQALSQIMKVEGFTLPNYSSFSQPVFEFEDAFHPLLSAPTPNNFLFSCDSNLCFVTGPNMSGKSIFLKTTGLLVYLAHLGFPVPASKLKISLFDGLFTTLNLSDNLNLGYSHFYSEVKRVKDIALKLNSRKKLFVIFDELFRGTNVKDAFDASLAIISALSKIRNNVFFISTHILEVAENLDNKDSIMFKCFESNLVDQKPVYDYKIKNGISKERIGMLIIKNENIVEILDEIVKMQRKELC